MKKRKLGIKFCMFTRKLSKKRVVTYFSIALFLCSFAFLIYYLGIQPYYSKKVTDKYRKLYYSDSVPSLEFSNPLEFPYADASIYTGPVEELETSFDVSLDNSFSKGAVDANGMLLKFSKLYEYNSDIRGWLHIDGTNVDYPVLQAINGSDFYLTHDFEGNKDKNGSLYIDGNTHISSKNLVIHGHNMKSTGMMFHELEKYNNISYYLKHPYFTFDTLFDESKWIIISIMKLPGDFSTAGGFNYIKSSFNNSDEYLNFLYEIKLRSIYNIPITVNERDSLVMLSTCSYELDNYRTVIVARKKRKGEKLKQNYNLTTVNARPFYGNEWYKRFGGKAPLKTTFLNALSFGEVSWYDGEITPINPYDSYVVDNNFIYRILSKDSVSFAGVLTSKIADHVISLDKTINNISFNSTAVCNTFFDSNYVDPSKYTEINIPDKITVNNREFNVIAIDDKALINCSKLTKITIGANIEAIGEKAFSGLKLLKTVNIKSSKINYIGEKAFPNPKKVKYKVRYSKEIKKKTIKAIEKMLNKYVKVHR
ncbi:MAG: sortase [Lachnospiraceae bacterium]|nr:sortase [Lachnospiraceae bacterium]